MAHQPTVELRFVGIGFGPMHLSLACYFGDSQVPPHEVRFLEQKPAFSWHSGLQFAGSLMQTPFLKDLVSMRNPRSEFTFVNYLKEHERLESFIDNRILYPTRSEYEHYLKWAARKTSAFVAYETPVELVEPVLDEAGQMTAFRVVTRTGEAFRCNLLSIGAGLAVAKRSAQDRVVQVAEYEYRIQRLLSSAAPSPRVLVIGAGQSGGEVVLDLLRRHAGIRVEIASRGFVFRTVEANSFVNGLFCERAQREFTSLPLETRKRWLNDLRLSNYGAVDEQVLSAISRLTYDEEVFGLYRLARRSYTEVLALSAEGEQMAAQLRDLHSGQIVSARYDFVVDCGGFGSEQAAGLITPLKVFLPTTNLAELELDENYAVKGLRSTSCKLFLHGYGTYLVDTTMICNIAQRAEAMGRLIHG
jgi:L-ornithine N5-monooxygenase